ncbi:MAG: YitT family protein [Christensenellales bacterium]
MKTEKIISNKQFFIDYAQIILGAFLGALAYPMFLVPNNIAPGGITGAATIINYLFKFPVGITSLMLNIPLFIVGYKSMGKRFVFRTLFATIFFSLLIDMLKIPLVTEDELLASLFGGGLLGLGLALILRGNATTGGTDLIARMVHKRFPVISIGLFLLIIDFIVVFAAGVTMGMKQALYAMLTVFACSKALDAVLAGIDTNKVCYIISKNNDAIKKRILEDMERGVTVFDAEGGYSGENVSMLLCVVNRLEIIRLKEIVRLEDHKAFLFVMNAHETLGEGFRALVEEN